MSAIYWSVYPSTQADPSIADVINGTVANAAASGSDTSPTTTGTFSDIATGLSASASYKIAAVWSDGTNDSALSVGGPFVTAAASASHSLSGTLTAQSGAIIGDFFREVVAIGTLTAQSASMSGSGQRKINASGELTAQSASMSGTSGNSGNTFGSGTLNAQSASMSGIGTRIASLSGSLTAANSELSGSLQRGVSLSGNLDSLPARITGVLSVNGEEVILSRGSGNIKITTSRQNP